MPASQGMARSEQDMFHALGFSDIKQEIPKKVTESKSRLSFLKKMAKASSLIQLQINNRCHIQKVLVVL